LISFGLLLPLRKTQGATKMTFDKFLTRVIDEGIAAAKADYTRPNQKHKLKGSIAGFEACRGKDTNGLKELLEATATATWEAHEREAKDYWWYRCYEAEVGWVCNCVSALLQTAGAPTIVTPTARGVLKAAEIVGVKGMN
jgi:hypothetical protein